MDAQCRAAGGRAAAVGFLPLAAPPTPAIRKPAIALPFANNTIEWEGWPRSASIATASRYRRFRDHGVFKPVVPTLAEDKRACRVSAAITLAPLQAARGRAC
jgi:hypothetical protein